MRRTRSNSGKALTALALSFPLAAVFTGTASSKARDHAASRPEIPYLSHGRPIRKDGDGRGRAARPPAGRLRLAGV